MATNSKNNDLNYKFQSIAEVDELPEGERLFVELDDEYIVVIHMNDTYYAIADLCSHDNGPLGDGDIEDHCIVCPRHGAKFNLESGEALTLPAVEAIPVYPVRIRDGMIEIGVTIN
jgi:3-phenylpropionate/trans-cinnamate dioxygenase ferredoxin subunit